MKPCLTVPELYELIQKETGIHRTRQRLFLGGEEMDDSKNLLDYFTTAHNAHLCTLTLHCFIPLLLSTFNCPGPMLVEIEVRPRNDEPVVAIKRRIRDKFRIAIRNQRLHVHPSEMTTFTLRQPLDNARLLSAYLSPGSSANFLELVVVNEPEQTCYNTSGRDIYIRIPRSVINTTKFAKCDNLQFSSSLNCKFSSSSPVPTDPVHLDSDGLPPPPPPQTPETARVQSAASTPDFHLTSVIEANTQPWWITFAINIDSIIKRDPKLEDILKILKQSLRDNFRAETNSSNSSNFNDSHLNLKYCKVKFSGGGKQLPNEKRIYKNLLVRREEMLLFVASPGLEENLDEIPNCLDDLDQKRNAVEPSVPQIRPMEPLESYDDYRIIYTIPSDPFHLSWTIGPTGAGDYGAAPLVKLELTGLSYSRKYGSWDIPEHCKTYVELILEGSFNVQDRGYAAMLDRRSANGLENLDHDCAMLSAKRGREEHEEGYSKKIVYYIQDAMEITIYAPHSTPPFRKGAASDRSKPFGSSTNEFIKERQKMFNVQQEMRRGEFKNPPMPRPAPFYKRIDDRLVNKTTLLADEITQSWKGRRQLSKNPIGQWCLSRERVSDVTVGRNQSTARIFACSCTRGSAKDGRDFCKIKYERRIPIASSADTIFPRSPLVDCVRNSLDFRIQTQFHISKLIEDQVELGDSADFKIEFRHWVTRIDHQLFTPDSSMQFESPSSCMDINFKISLANQKWMKSMGLDDLPANELQTMS